MSIDPEQELPEELEDATSSLHQALDATPPTKRSLRTGAQSSLLVLMGLGAAAAGLALAVGAKLSWKAAQIMVGFDYLGIHGGTLLMGGLVLVGLGILRRGQGQVAAQMIDDGESDLLVEDMAGDVVQMRHSLDHLQSVTAGLQNEVRALGGLIDEIRQVEAARDSNEQGGQQDAMFRLAASLDQLGGRLEQRLQGQVKSIEQHIETVGERVLEATREAAMAVASNATETSPRSQLPPDDGPESPLGVLDRIDDVPSALPKAPQPEARTAPATAVAATRTAEAQEPGAAETGGLSLAMPGDPSADGTPTAGPANTNPMMDEARLRDALEDIRRRGGE